MPDGKRVNGGKTAAAAPAKAKRPRLGQNFLHDAGAAGKIVAALGDISGRTVLEIGPGRGILTSHLASRAKRLIAVELDRVLAAQLRMKYARHDNVEVIEADILRVELPILFRGSGPAPLAGVTPPPPEKALVVGNLPYYITSDILLRLFENHEYFGTIVIMVQEEVADRIAAKPGSRDYGLLSATAQLYTRVEKLFTLPPGAFAPPPKVHSSVLRMTVDPQFHKLKVDENGFIEFLKLSFGQKRKTLFNNLRSRYEPAAVQSALKKASLRSDVRAEAVPLEKAAAVYRALENR